MKIAIVVAALVVFGAAVYFLVFRSKASSSGSAGSAGPRGPTKPGQQ